MAEVVAEFRELIEDDIVRVAGQFVAGVVDLLDVGFGPGGPDDVLGPGDPSLEPLEAFG